MKTEYAQFINLMRTMGLPVSHIHCLDKEHWQSIVNQGGYNITSLATHGIEIGSVVFIFVSGKPCWYPPYDNDSGGFGPPGSFIMAYDRSSKKILHRRNVRFADGQVVGSDYGAALFATICGKSLPKNMKPLQDEPHVRRFQPFTYGPEFLFRSDDVLHS